jgi:hypothetical protein
MYVYTYGTSKGYGYGKRKYSGEFWEAHLLENLSFLTANALQQGHVLRLLFLPYAHSCLSKGSQPTYIHTQRERIEKKGSGDHHLALFAFSRSSHT